MKIDEREEDPGARRIMEFEQLVENLIRNQQGEIDERSLDKIDQLIGEINNGEDPVYQVNCLQLIADLACSKKALAVLEEKEVHKKLINLLNESDPLIVPHALKFFYRINPIDLELKYSQVLDKICEYCVAENKQLLDYAVDFIASVGRGGYTARLVLDKHPNFHENCLRQFGRTIISSDNIIKSRTLRCICDLLESHEEDPKEESSKLSEKFYFNIIEGQHKMTNQLLSLCRVPFIEIRINAMLIVAAVANEIWAQRELESHPNFLKWLLDRSSETCKESKEAKFSILQTLVKSRTTVRFFKGEDYMKMRADFKNGPFHVGIAEEMLMDNQQAQ